MIEASPSGSTKVKGEGCFCWMGVGKSACGRILGHALGRLKVVQLDLADFGVGHPFAPSYAQQHS